MAQVSGIEVVFKADTSNFDKGVASAESRLQSFSKIAVAGIAGLGAAAAAGGIAIGALTKNAIDLADNIGKTAQKIGIASESLSRLEYAAKLSDVSLGQLQVGLGQLARNMQENNDAFAALGVTVTNANGGLRGTEEILLDIAERFAGMQDGAGKTAIAMQLFGRSGADLIPFLNSGRDGIAQLTAEADKFGVTISTSTSRAAEGFNDNLTRLGAVLQGLGNAIAEKSAPAMRDLTDRFITFVKEGNYVERIADAIASVMNTLAEGVQFASTTWEILTVRINGAIGALQGIANLDLEAATKAWNAASEETGRIWQRNVETLAEMRGEVQSVNRALKGDREDQKGPAPTLPQNDSGDGLSKSSTDSQPFSMSPSQEPGSYFTDRLQTIRDEFATERELLAEEYALNQQVLDNALANKMIKEEEYRRLTEQLEQQHQDKLKGIRLSAIQENLGYASDFMGSMAQIAELGGKKTTKIAKAFGIAQALISTFQGAAKALTLPFPANMAAYASVLAQGLSAVASIRKVSENGGSNGSVGGAAGGGMSASGGGGGAGGGGAGPTTTFAFTLTNDPMGFGEKFARQFIDQLNSTQRNGGQIRGVIA